MTNSGIQISTSFIGGQFKSYCKTFSNPFLTSEICTNIDSYFEIRFTSFNDIYAIKNFLPDTYYQLILEKKCILFLHNEFEGDNFIADAIYTELIIEMKIPESQIILVTGALDIDSYIQYAAKKFTKKTFTTYTCICGFNYFGFPFATHYGCKITEKKFIYEKKFLFLAKRCRLQRALLAILLQYEELLSDGYVSLQSEKNFNIKNYFAKILNLLINHYEIYDFVSKNENLLCSLDNLILDEQFSENSNRPHAYYMDVNPKLYDYIKNSYFSIISETNFFTSENRPQSIFFSEKTFKTILVKHPFILLNVPYSLKKLKELGFKTFSPYINEDYDEEVDDIKRMFMIVKEIKKLCGLTEKELVEFINFTFPICEHNYKIACNFTNIKTSLKQVL